MIIENPTLRKRLKSFPCIVCGKNGPSDVHHHREKGMGAGFQLDIIENLSPVCHEHHMMKHSSPDQFRREWGLKMYEYLDNFKDGYTLSDIERLYGGTHE
jgi:hypothetical protein